MLNCIRKKIVVAQIQMNNRTWKIKKKKDWDYVCNSTFSTIGVQWIQQIMSCWAFSAIKWVVYRISCLCLWMALLKDIK